MRSSTQVYIFKHVTVTGVYITMFVKYVCASPEYPPAIHSLLGFPLLQWLHILLVTLLPSSIL